MTSFKKFIVVILVFGIFLSLIPVNIHAYSNNYYTNKYNATNSKLSKIDPKFSKDYINELFSLIVNIPDSKLATMSKNELLKYFNAKSNKIVFIEKETSNINIPLGLWEATKCGAAVISVLAGTFFVGAKLLKLKKYIKALGGAKEAAYLVYLYFHYGEFPKDAAENVIKSIQKLAALVLGIDSIQENCSKIFD